MYMAERLITYKYSENITWDFSDHKSNIET